MIDDKKILELFETLMDLGRRETSKRLEMCMTVSTLLVEVASAQNKLARVVADLPSLPESEKQQVLSTASRLETACERLEASILGSYQEHGSPGSRQ